MEAKVLTPYEPWRSQGHGPTAHLNKLNVQTLTVRKPRVPRQMHLPLHEYKVRCLAAKWWAAKKAGVFRYIAELVEPWEIAIMNSWRGHEAIACYRCWTKGGTDRGTI